MSTDCVTATLKDNIYELAVLMKKHDIGFIPIVEGTKLIGVVTDRDLVVRGYAEKHSGSTSVETVMTSDVETISPDASADEAVKRMASHQIRRLVVVENGHLAGVLAIGDLAVRNVLVQEAGEALSHISESAFAEQPVTHH
ncbi:CBS domain-containing protein [Paenibacillus sp. NEAU-GSW1]|uniref:CBS domain-containing protein n=1 Tax=Paenibacillus sp. NEAU-GSW1 TaxID=2682486 RepID=UPI0020A67B6B|nr:CBS domain-containing protein [Paenibacillus sp. NEAU-GSW1]